MAVFFPASQYGFSQLDNKTYRVTSWNTIITRLGLNFCPIPTTTPKNINESLAQFTRDASTKFFWAGSPPLAATDLFIRSE